MLRVSKQVTPNGDCASSNPSQPFSTTELQTDFYLTPPEDRQVSFDSPAMVDECVQTSSQFDHDVDDAGNWHNRPAGTGKNNNGSHDHDRKHAAPNMPEPSCDIGLPDAVKERVAYPIALWSDRNKYVTLNFRVMRHDAEMHVGQIVNLCSVRRTELYTARILDRWTLKLRVKLKSTVNVSIVFKSLAARLGLRSSVGLKYCLDGFYGVEAFGDAFRNYGAGVCPWMEVTGDGSPSSLHLDDGDNIYVNMVTEKMAELARRRAQRASEQSFKQGARCNCPLQPAMSARGDRLSVASVAFNSPFDPSRASSVESES